MADNSAIEWTDSTWNPVTGCTKITDGCKNCYAARLAERFRGVAGHPFENGFDITLKPHKLDQPIRWKRPRTIFVNSMSDLFHKQVPTEYIDQVFDVMEQADHHRYQVLTKRSSLMRNYLRLRYADRAAPEHIWLGVSVEHAGARSRIDHLRQAPAAVRFLSVEADWVREVRDECVRQGVAFFFKQWGGIRPRSGGRTLDDRLWSEMPRAA